MARRDAGFTIRRPFQAPATRGFSMSAITAAEWPHIAENLNVVRVDIATAESQPETHAVFPAWRYGRDDTRLEQWHRRPMQGEEDAVALVQEKLQGELDELLLVASPSEAQLQRIYELQRDHANLTTWAYWQEVYNSFGDGACTLYRACNAPNVPFKLRSNWRLQPDRPFTLFVHRCKPSEGQQDCWLRFRFGHWALTIRQENQVKLTRYRDGRWYEESETEPGRNRGTWHTFAGTDFDAIDALEEQEAAIRDEGRLTQAEKLLEAQWKQSIRDTQALLKKGGRTLAADVKANYQAIIAGLKSQIKTLKDSKSGLTSAQEAQIKAIRKQLIASETDVQFEHMAQDTFGQDMALTIIPQRRGFVVIHNSMGRDYFVCEDELVTDSETEPEATIVDATPLQVDGNGGSCWFKVSGIEPVQYARLDSGIIAVQGVSGEADVTVDGTQMPGTTVTAKVTPAGTGGSEAFRWSATFTSAAGSGYLPFLYRLYFDVVASSRPRHLETVVADSALLPELSWEVGSDHDEEHRGRSATWSFHLTREQRVSLAWLLDLAHCQIAFRETETWFTGVLMDPEVTELAGGSLDVTYRCYDRWYLLRTDRVWSDVIGDGKPLGQYVYQLARGIGLWDDEISVEGFTSAGDLLSGRLTSWAQFPLPQAHPGDQPSVRPEWGSSRADTLTKLLDDLGPFLDLWFDGRGVLHLAQEQTTTKPFRYSRSHSSATDTHVMRGVSVENDWTDYCNDLTVLGAKYRGKELSARYRDFATVSNPAHPYYVGRWIAAEPYQNNALVTQGHVNLCARNRARRYMRPRRRISFTTDYDDRLSVGDRVSCDGDAVEVLSISSDERAGGDMRVSGRLVSPGE